MNLNIVNVFEGKIWFVVMLNILRDYICVYFEGNFYFRYFNICIRDELIINRNLFS